MFQKCIIYLDLFSLWENLYLGMKAMNIYMSSFKTISFSQFVCTYIVTATTYRTYIKIAMLTFNDRVPYICPIFIINSSSINVSTIWCVNIRVIIRIISLPYWFMDYRAGKYTCWFGAIFFATILVWAWPRFMPKIMTCMTLNRPTKLTIFICW